jgi:hypothetical protein
MLQLTGILTEGLRNFHWQLLRESEGVTERAWRGDPAEREAGVRFTGLPRFSYLPEEEALGALADVLENAGVRWIRPVDTPPGEWVADLDEIRANFPGWFPMEWFVGEARVTPAVGSSRGGGWIYFELCEDRPEPVE